MIIKIINIISLIPLLFYPMLFVSGVMIFDSPGSTKSLTAWLVFLASVGYPFIIGLFVFLSIRYKSFLFALLGILPLIIIVYFLFVSGGSSQKDNFNKLNREYVCDKNSFLFIDGKPEDKIRSVRLLEKKNFFTYKNDTIATIRGGKWINVSLKRDTQSDNLLNVCKDSSGKTPYQNYIKIEDEQVGDINKQIQKESVFNYKNQESNFSFDYPDLGSLYKISLNKNSIMYSMNSRLEGNTGFSIVWEEVYAKKTEDYWSKQKVNKNNVRYVLDSEEKFLDFNLDSQNGRELRFNVSLPGGYLRKKKVIDTLINSFKITSTEVGGEARQIKENDIVGYWTPGFNAESMAFSIEDGEYVYSSYLHDRPLDIGTWKLEDDKLIIKTGTGSDSTVFTSIVREGNKLKMKDGDGLTNTYNFNML